MLPRSNDGSIDLLGARNARRYAKYGPTIDIRGSLVGTGLRTARMPLSVLISSLSVYDAPATQQLALKGIST